MAWPSLRRGCAARVLRDKTSPRASCSGVRVPAPCVSAVSDLKLLTAVRLEPVAPPRCTAQLFEAELFSSGIKCVARDLSVSFRL